MRRRISPHVGPEPARADVADHAGRRDVIVDALVLAIVALAQLPARGVEGGERAPAFAHLVGGQRPAHDAAEPVGCERDGELPAVAAADVEDRVAGVRLEEVDGVLELAPLRPLQRIERIVPADAGPHQLVAHQPLGLLEHRAGIRAIRLVEVEVQRLLRDVVVAGDADARARRSLEGAVAPHVREPWVHDRPSWAWARTSERT